MIARNVQRTLWLLMGCVSLMIAGGSAHADGPALKAKTELKIADFYAMRNEQIRLLESDKSGKTTDGIFKEIFAAEDRLCRDLVNLCMEMPASQAAKKALIWVMNKPNRGEQGDYGVEFYRAAYLLVRYHGNDAEAASLGLWMDKQIGPGRDLFIYGMNAAAKEHNAKGIARLSLALYLNAKVMMFQRIQKEIDENEKALEKKPIEGTAGLDSTILNAPVAAYTATFMHLDRNALAAQAVRLFEEVARDYPDVPAKSSLYLEKEEGVRSNPPMRVGKLLSPDEVEQIRKVLARPVPSLSDSAKRHLDELLNLVEGKPAPEIDSEGVDGKRFKLSDYRGKIVVLIFWGTWCGPCMAEVPNERALAEKYKGKPVALLGVDCEEDRSLAIEAMKREGISWPNWFDGTPGEGPIAKAYHVRIFPTMMVIDGDGIIRSKFGNSESAAKLIDTLLAEMQAKGTIK